MNKELIAKNHSGITIIWRWIDGKRYLKVIPANIMPLIIEQIKNKFPDGSIKITKLLKKENDNFTGWVLVEKTEMADNNKIINQVKSSIIDKFPDIKNQIEAEKNMLEKLGFIVEVKDI
jgi:hypothetical protein